MSSGLSRPATGSASSCSGQEGPEGRHGHTARLPNVQSAHRCPGNTHPDRKSNMVRRLAIPKTGRRAPGARSSRGAPCRRLRGAAAQLINSRSTRSGQPSHSNQDGGPRRAIRDRDGVRRTDCDDASHEGRARTSGDSREPEQCRCSGPPITGQYSPGRRWRSKRSIPKKPPQPRS